MALEIKRGNIFIVLQTIFGTKKDGFILTYQLLPELRKRGFSIKEQIV